MLLSEEIPAMPKTSTPRAKEVPDRLMTRLEAAAWLGVSKQYLAALASQGEGPKYKVLGRKAMYMASDVKAWWEAQAYASPAAERELEATEPKVKKGRPKKDDAPKPEAASGMVTLQVAPELARFLQAWQASQTNK